MPNSDQVLQLLQQLEAQLRQCGLWQATAPNAQALASTEPFCVDTLAFEQWLQFVLIPKLRLMIAEHAPLPTNVSMAPMAEYAFAQQPQLSPLINTIATIDTELSQS